MTEKLPAELRGVRLSARDRAVIGLVVAVVERVEATGRDVETLKKWLAPVHDKRCQEDLAQRRYIRSLAVMAAEDKRAKRRRGEVARCKSEPAPGVVEVDRGSASWRLDWFDPSRHGRKAGQ